MTDQRPRFQTALERLDTLHAEDPRREQVEGKDIPHELLYAQRMSAWLEHIAPEASEALRLAVRAQHLQRWRIPRDAYPSSRSGYLNWRRELGRQQAELAASVLGEAGYEDTFCEYVASLIRKENLRHDPQAQALEDTACLVFIEHYLTGFSAGHDEEKLIRIIRKTWNKMSPRGHKMAMTIPLSAENKALVQKALG